MALSLTTEDTEANLITEDAELIFQKIRKKPLGISSAFLCGE